MHIGKQHHRDERGRVDKRRLISAGHVISGHTWPWCGTIKLASTDFSAMQL
jgi:hypothetical protein